MLFWVYMLVVSLVIPAMMFVLGRKYIKAPPKNINASSGFRAGMSMKNPDTWAFAHAHFGRLLKNTAPVLAAAAVIAMLFLIGRDYGTIGGFSIAIVLVELAAYVCICVLTIKALKKNFDENGKRKL